MTRIPFGEVGVAWESDKPSQNEDEYFARRDANWLRERRESLDVDRAKREKMQQMMRCPRCGGHLSERAFAHVTADVCDQCRGVWLDAGEMEMVAQIPRDELLRLGRDIGTDASAG
ncbi:MAG: zf-TFIIB domain-containing protein [Gemmatimonadaceae bacterium]